jgi:hypothetical protein
MAPTTPIQVRIIIGTLEEVASWPGDEAATVEQLAAKRGWSASKTRRLLEERNITPVVQIGRAAFYRASDAAKL